MRYAKKRRNAPSLEITSGLSTIDLAWVPLLPCVKEGFLLNYF